MNSPFGTGYQLFLIVCVLCVIGDIFLHIGEDRNMDKVKAAGMIFLLAGCLTLTGLVFLSLTGRI